MMNLCHFWKLSSSLLKILIKFKNLPHPLSPWESKTLFFKTLLPSSPINLCTLQSNRWPLILLGKQPRHYNINKISKNWPNWSRSSFSELTRLELSTITGSARSVRLKRATRIRYRGRNNSTLSFTEQWLERMRKKWSSWDINIKKRRRNSLVKLREWKKNTKANLWESKHRSKSWSP